jgi:hypothetical protein
VSTSETGEPGRESPAAENPILSEAELPRWNVSASRPVPKATSRLVFVDSKGRVLAPEHPMTLGEVVWGGLRRMYEVDIAEHRAQFHAQVPCREKGFSFDVEFQLSWRVNDPARIVQDGCEDVGPVYRSYLIERVSELSERYGLEDRLAAEQALKQALAGVSDLPEGISLRKCALTLSLGPEAHEHFRSRTLNAFDTETRHMRHADALDEARLGKSELAAQDEIEVLKGELRAKHRLRQLEQEQELGTLKNQLELQETQHRLALERQRQLAEATAQLEIDELKRQLERQRAEHQLEIESQRGQRQLEVKLERMGFYKKALEGGNLASLIPLFLDEDSGNVGQLINLVVNQDRDNRENARKVLEVMLEAGVVNGRQLDDARRAALQKLLQGLNADPFGSADDKPAIEPVQEEPASSDADDDDDEDDEDDGEPKP